MSTEEFVQRLQRYAEKVLNDRAYVAPEIEAEWLKSKIVEGLLQIDRDVAQKVVDLEGALNILRRDLLRSGNANMPPATARTRPTPPLRRRRTTAPSLLVTPSSDTSRGPARRRGRTPRRPRSWRS